MERMCDVSLQVERQRNSSDQFLLGFPRTGVDMPADEGVFVQPIGQFFLAGDCEGHPVAASDAPQFDSQFFLQQTPESEAER